MSDFSGLGLHMGNLSLRSRALTRSISPENPTGGKGQGAMAEDGPSAAARAWRSIGLSRALRALSGPCRTSTDLIAAHCELAAASGYDRQSRRHASGDASDATSNIWPRAKVGLWREPDIKFLVPQNESGPY